MNLENEFDELARRKLQELEHPFEEANWDEAQRMITAQRKGRGGRMIIGAMALLFLGTAAWWATRPNDAASPTSVAEQAAPKATPPHTSGGSTSPVSTSTVDATRSNTLQTPTHATITASSSTGTTTTSEEKAHTSVPATAQRTGTGTLATRTGTRTFSTSRLASTTPEDHNDRHNVLPSNTTATSTSTTAHSSAAHGTMTPAADQVAQGPFTDPMDRTIIDQVSPGSNPNTPTDTRSDKSDKGTTAPSGAKSDTGSDTTAPIAKAASGEPSDTGSPQDGERNGTPVADEAGARRDTSASGPVGDTLLVDMPLPQDSIAATPSPVAAPPLVDPRAPWEISVLGGIRMNNTRYAGPLSDDQSLSSQGMNSAMLGAELMHMGHHFGVGAGVFHGSYTERLSVKERDVTTTVIRPYWYLVPVDTTILVITDTLAGPGDTLSYVGVPVGTTINVLARSADTTSTTERLREAREVLNRTSYVEVAPLFDAHLMQGRWTLGVRGGPTFGLLSGRKGTLPNSTNDGYVPFEDEAFRELVIGFHARAYIRYRWNAAWSIGVEPMVGGQLMNALDGDRLDRRSMAWGGLISLSYRLR
jgi:hypothetical protein